MNAVRKHDAGDADGLTGRDAAGATLVNFESQKWSGAVPGDDHAGGRGDRFEAHAYQRHQQGYAEQYDANA